MTALSSRRSIRSAFAIVAVAAFFALAGAFGSGITSPAQAGPSGITYQQVTHFVMNQASTPAPGSYFSGSFDADYQTATAGAAPKKGGLFASIKWAMSAMKSLQNGFAETDSYYNGMKREDKPDQTATIYIPAKNQRIELNLANKTYQIIDETPTAATPETPEPMPQMSAGPTPSAEPGTADVAVTVTTTDLGSKMLSNVQAEGYQIDSKIVSTHAVGSCKNGTFEAVMTEFVSTYPEPTEAPRPAQKMTMPAKMPTMPSMASVMSALKNGCVPKFTANIQHGATIPVGRLSVWQAFGGSGAMGGQSPPQGNQGTNGMGSSGSASFAAVIERGNVRQLGPADASLFEIPAGFTQVH